MNESPQMGTKSIAKRCPSASRAESDALAQREMKSRDEFRGMNLMECHYTERKHQKEGQSESGKNSFLLCIERERRLV